MKLLLILGAVTLSVALAILAAYENWFGLSLSHEINVVDLLTLAVTVAIGLVLQDYFAAKASNFRVEKDIVIADLSRIIDSLHECRSVVFSCQEEGKISHANRRSIVAFLRQVSNGIEGLEFTLEMTKCSTLRAECKTLQDDYFRYKTSITGGSFPKPYSIADLSAQESSFKSFYRDLKLLVFRVNVHH